MSQCFVSARMNMEEINIWTKKLTIVHCLIQWRCAQSIHGRMRQKDRGRRICFLLDLSNSYFQALGYQCLQFLDLYTEYMINHHLNPILLKPVDLDVIILWDSLALQLVDYRTVFGFSIIMPANSLENLNSILIRGVGL